MGPNEKPSAEPLAPEQPPAPSPTPIEEVEGYRRFREAFHLQLERSVGVATGTEADRIEAALTKQWELYKNLSGKKSQSQLWHDAYYLDHGDQVLSHLAEVNDEDEQVFEMIKDFIADIYMGNLERYLEERGRHIVGVPMSAVWPCIALPLVLFLGLLVVGQLGSESGFAIYGIVAAVLAFVIAFFVSIERAWTGAVATIKQSRSAYEESIKHSVHILDRNLGEVTRRLTTRMRDAGDELEKLDLSNEGGFARGQTLVGYLLRLRERRTAHRDFYRAYIDLFVRAKGRLLFWEHVRRVWRLRVMWAIAMALIVVAATVAAWISMSGPSGLGAIVAISLTFLVAAAGVLFMGAATWAGHVFGSKVYTSNVDDVVIACLRESAWARDSDEGDATSRLDLILRKALLGSNTHAVNKALLTAGKNG